MEKLARKPKWSVVDQFSLISVKSALGVLSLRSADN